MAILFNTLLNVIIAILPLFLILFAARRFAGGGGLFLRCLGYGGAAYLFAFSLTETDPLPSVIARLALRVLYHLHFPFQHLALALNFTVLSGVLVLHFNSRSRGKFAVLNYPARWLRRILLICRFDRRSRIPLFAIIALTASGLVSIAAYEFHHVYALDFTQILFHLRFLNTAGLREIIADAAAPVLLSGVCALLLLRAVGRMRFWRVIWKNGAPRARSFAIISLGAAMLAMGIFIKDVVGWNFIGRLLTGGDTFVTEHYIDPSRQEFSFPEKRRNLIVIFVEALETGFLLRENGGGFAENCTPNTTRLATENLNFSGDNQIGGLIQVRGAGWTQAGTMAYFAGLPSVFKWYGGDDHADNLLGAREAHSLFSDTANCATVGAILAAHGYRNYAILRPGLQFGGQGVFYISGMRAEVFDAQRLRERGYLTGESQSVWHDLSDRQMYAAAKKMLTEIAANPSPFCFITYTLETHHPIENAMSPDKERKFASPEANVIFDMDKQLGEFVAWLQNQDFYKNTVVVILGDHLQPVVSFHGLRRPERHPLNIFINSQLTPEFSKNRRFTHFDLFPTILEALGIDCPAAGLGRSLNRPAPTLIEQFGRAALGAED